MGFKQGKSMVAQHSRKITPLQHGGRPERVRLAARRALGGFLQQPGWAMMAMASSRTMVMRTRKGWIERGLRRKVCGGMGKTPLSLALVGSAGWGEVRTLGLGREVVIQGQSRPRLQWRF